MANTSTQPLREAVHQLGAMVLLLSDSLRSAFARRCAWKDFIAQFHFIGLKSQSVVLVTGAFTGMVLCAQTYYQFHKVRMDSATLAIVSVSMCSELGPVLTALMVAGRAGAAIAAEIGTMRVTEQIDALRTLATNPIDYLVAPRLLATILAMPLLMTESIVLGIGAAYAVGVFLLGIDPAYSWSNMLHYTDRQDFETGLIKSVIFGGIIAVVACYEGMNCREGAQGVGEATTTAVVVASITVLVSNFFLTLFLTPLLG